MATCSAARIIFSTLIFLHELTDTELLRKAELSRLSSKHSGSCAKYNGGLASLKIANSCQVIREWMFCKWQSSCFLNVKYLLRLSHQNRVQRLQLEESCVSCLKINLAIYSAFNIVLILLTFMGMMGLLFFHGIISLVCNATLLLSLIYVTAVSPDDPSDGVVLAKAAPGSQSWIFQ